MHATQTPPAPTQSQPYAESTSSAPAGRRRRGLIIGLSVLALAIAAAIAGLLINNSSKSDQLVLGKPKLVSSAQLSSYAHSAKRPVFWAGPAAAAFQLELTEVRGQRVYIRYLTKSAKAGDPRPAFTTVATYPMKGAATTLKAFSSRPGAVSGTAPGGATTLYYKKLPSNVYVAKPGLNYLIEIYAPQPKAAQQLAQSPTIAAVK